MKPVRSELPSLLLTRSLDFGYIPAGHVLIQPTQLLLGYQPLNVNYNLVLFDFQSAPPYLKVSIHAPARGATQRGNTRGSD